MIKSDLKLDLKIDLKLDLEIDLKLDVDPAATALHFAAAGHVGGYQHQP
jgi:hypothetical protein